jgi:hypothetical protein
MKKFVWINHYLPQTLQVAVMLGYISAAFSVLLYGITNFSPIFMLLIAVTVLGSFGIANIRWWGYILALISAILPFALPLFFIVFGTYKFGDYVSDSLLGTNIISTIFNVAFLVLLVHPMSLNYVKRNFEKTIP